MPQRPLPPTPPPPDRSILSIPADAQIRQRGILDAARDVVSNPLQAAQDIYQRLQPRAEIAEDPRWKLGFMPDTPSREAMQLVSSSRRFSTLIHPEEFATSVVKRPAHSIFVDRGGNFIDVGGDTHMGAVREAWPEYFGGPNRTYREELQSFEQAIKDKELVRLSFLRPGTLTGGNSGHIGVEFHHPPSAKQIEAISTLAQRSPGVQYSLETGLLKDRTLNNYRTVTSQLPRFLDELGGFAGMAGMAAGR